MLGVCATTAAIAWADDYEWNTIAADSYFDQATNWTPVGGPPGADDRARFSDFNTPYTVNFQANVTTDQAAVDAGDLAHTVTWLGNDSIGYTYTLTRDDGVNRGLQVTHGHLAIEKLTVDVTDRVIVGGSPLPSQLTVAQGGMLLCDYLVLGTSSGAATVALEGTGFGSDEESRLVADTIRANGETFTTSYHSEIRVNDLVAFGDTPVFNGSLAFGTSRGSTAAAYTVSAGESLTVGHTLSVGHDKQATFTQTGGTVSSTPTTPVRIAKEAGSGGSTYALSGGLLQSNINVGEGDAGTLNQSNGTIDGSVTVERNGTYNYSGGTLTGGIHNHGALSLDADLTVGTSMYSYVDFTLGSGRGLNITDEFTIGGESTFTLMGSLDADSVEVGPDFDDSATLRQTAGSTLSVATELSLPGDAPFPKTTGIYELQGGTASANDVLLGGLWSESSGVVAHSGGTLTVGDTLRIGNPDVPTATGSYTLSDSGSLIVDTIVLNANGTLTMNGGTLAATTFTGSLTNSAGTLAPGASAGTLAVSGDYTQGDGARLEIEIAGTTQGVTYDLIDVEGALNLDGTLNVVLAGYNPVLGDVFDILDWGSLGGMFDVLDLPSLNSGLSWDTSALYDDGRISVVPEPTSLALLGLGGLTLLRRRRA
jgi:hypothetical protein